MKEALAYYDRTTGEIIGAKEDTLVYYHEEGHKHFSKYFDKIYVFSSGFYMLAIFCFMMESNNIMIQLIGGIMFAIMMMDELLSWGYALRQLKKVR